MAANDPLFLYQLKLTPHYTNSTYWTEETHKIIEAHADFIHALAKAGHLVFAGRTALEPNDADLLGIAVIQASDLDTAKRLLADDPGVIHGIQQAKLHPFSMGIRYFHNLNPS